MTHTASLLGAPQYDQVGPIRSIEEHAKVLCRRGSGRHVRLVVCGAALTLGILAFSGCASSRERARDGAITAVRVNAAALGSELESAARGSSGVAQLEAVRAVLPGPQFTATAAGEGVTVTGAMTAVSEAGGGLTYERFSARLCLRYRIAAGSGQTGVADAPCPDANKRGQVDETIRLAD